MSAEDSPGILTLGRLVLSSVLRAFNTFGDFIMRTLPALIALGVSAVVLMYLLQMGNSSLVAICDFLSLAWRFNPLVVVGSLSLDVITGLVGVFVIGLMVVPRDAQNHKAIKISAALLWLIVISYCLNFIWSPLSLFAVMGMGYLQIKQKIETNESVSYQSLFQSLFSRFAPSNGVSGPVSSRLK